MTNLVHENPEIFEARAPSTQIAEYSATAAGLAELRSRLSSVVYDVTKPEEMVRARADRRECVKLRTSLEALRVQIKAPALERSRLIDAEAKDLNRAIYALEVPIDEQITKEEKRVAAEKEVRLEAERKRIDTIRSSIEYLRQFPVDAIGKPAAQARALLTALEGTAPLAAGYQEFHVEALATWERSAMQMREIVRSAERNEAEEKRIAEARAELERQTAAENARQAEARAKIAAEEAEAKRVREAADAEARAKREADEREANERRAADDLRARTEREAADRAAAEARDKANREAQEAREFEEARTRQAAADAERKAQAEREERLREVRGKLALFNSKPPTAAFILQATQYRAAPADDCDAELAALVELFARALWGSK